MADYPIQNGNIEVKVIKGKSYTFTSVDTTGYSDATFDPTSFIGGDPTAAVKVQAKGVLTLTIQADGTPVTDFTGYTFTRVSAATAGYETYTAVDGAIVQDAASSTVTFNYLPYVDTTGTPVYIRIQDSTTGLDTVETISMTSIATAHTFDTTMTQTLAVTDFGYGFAMTGNVTVDATV